MIYQCKYGKAIEMSVEQYLNMSDAELEYFNTYATGDSIEDPWFGSVLSKLPPPDIDLDFSEDEEEEMLIKDLTDISREEKFIDPDIDFNAFAED